MAPVPDTYTTESVPISWLNKQFLETALQKGYNKPTLRIIDYDVKEAVGKGENYCSDLYRLSIHTSDGRVSRLIIKKELKEGDFAEVIKVSSAFSREIQMYSTTALQLFSILERAMPDVCEPFAARYVYSCPGTIVVDDLCAQGFMMAGRQKGLDLPHCMLVMRTLGRFHAASVALHDQNPDSMSLFDQNFFTEPAAKEGLNKFFVGSLQSVANAVDSWPGYGERYGPKLHALAGEILDRIEESTKRDDSSFNVLTHGDLWVNNIMFRYSGPGGKVDSLRFIDYQFLHYSSPAIDLVYFFNTSLSSDVRENKIDQLMKEYHSTLCETLQILGYSREPISLEELKKDCDKHVIYGVHAACCVLPIVLSENGMDLDAVMGSGDSRASAVYNGEFYKKALQSMLPEFEKNGAFRK